MNQRAPLKYPGSKQLMMKRLLRHLPKKGDVLIDVFIGSASVPLNTEYKEYHLNDANTDLISLYRFIQQDVSTFIIESRKLFNTSTNNPEFYYSVREKFNQSQDTTERALLLLYLNRHCFNGLLRYNSRGIFNTPFGRYSSPYYPEKELKHFAEKLEDATFYNMEFSDFLYEMEDRFTGRDMKCQCYVDPPYIKHDEQTQVFTQYTANGFSLNHHRALNKQLTDNRAMYDKVLVSNHEGKRLKEIYKGAVKTVRFRVPRTISSSVTKRTSAPEVLLYY
ncbi:Dam family site-specific DNA-(adenine-N6)-methyltransferase [uncultured Alteromonas sp.]|jgi:DNA adenine methylase|uniref:DNA adenine methylase n=1 Tax=uncultured Alteromonas sp. TaxID=179113 RepID=UPI0030DC4EBD